MSALRDGLKEEVKTGLIYFVGEPRNIDELIERAQLVDRRLWESHQERKEKTMPFAKKRDRAQGSVQKDRDGDTVMTGAQVDLKEARKKGLCFKCGRKGHQAKNCRVKKDWKGKRPEREEVEARMVLYQETRWNSEVEDSADEWEVYEDPEPEYTMPRVDQSQTGDSESELPAKESCCKTKYYECPSAMKGLTENCSQTRTDEGLPETESEDEAIIGAQKILVDIERQRKCQQNRERSKELRENRRQERQESAQDTVKQHHEGNLKGQKVHVGHRDLGNEESPELRDLHTETDDGVVRNHTVADRPQRYDQSDWRTTNQLDSIRWREVKTSERPAWKEFCRVRKARLGPDLNQWLKEENLRNRDCRCYGYDFSCWGSFEESWDDHTVNQATGLINCQRCFNWMMKYCPVGSHHWKNKKKLLRDISTRKMTVFEEPLATEDGQLCCSKNWCLHEFHKHREVEIPWWACYSDNCREHAPMKKRNGSSPCVPRITMRNAQKCPCLRIGCICGFDKRHPFHLEMSSNQTCVSWYCRSHNAERKAVEASKIKTEIDQLTKKINNWKIGKAKEEKTSTMKIGIEVGGQPTIAEIDCGATVNFANRQWTEKQGLLVTGEGTAVVTLFDGTEKEVLKRSTEISFRVGNSTHRQTFRVLEETGANKVVLGMPWLKEYNPDIDWKNRRIKIGQVGIDEPSIMKESAEMQDYEKRLMDAKKRVPAHYHEYLEVFAKQE